MKLNWIVKIMLILGLVGGLIALISLQKPNYEKVIVKFVGDNEIGFVSEQDIITLIHEGQDSSMFSKLNLRLVEQKIRTFQFIKDCEVSRDLRGNLIVEITQSRPLARIVAYDTQSKGGYISEEAQILPLSPHFTARVVLLTGEGTKLLNENYLGADGKDLIDFLRFIDSEAFWKAQISQIDIDKYGRLKIYTQVGEQEILFGTAENFNQKLEKLYTFYQNIVPSKGWKAYKTVDLQYDNQIVCK